VPDKNQAGLLHNHPANENPEDRTLHPAWLCRVAAHRPGDPGAWSFLAVRESPRIPTGRAPDLS